MTHGTIKEEVDGNRLLLTTSRQSRSLGIPRYEAPIVQNSSALEIKRVTTSRSVSHIARFATLPSHHRRAARGGFSVASDKTIGVSCQKPHHTVGTLVAGDARAKFPLRGYDRLQLQRCWGRFFCGDLGNQPGFCAPYVYLCLPGGGGVRERVRWPTLDENNWMTDRMARGMGRGRSSGCVDRLISGPAG